MVSSTRRTAGCGPACPVVWQGRVGDHFPYADFVECGSLIPLSLLLHLTSSRGRTRLQRVAKLMPFAPVAVCGTRKSGSKLPHSKVCGGEHSLLQFPGI